MSIFLGVDAGQSHLEVVLHDSLGKLLCIGRIGPWIQFAGKETEYQFAQAFKQVLDEATAQSGILLKDGVSAACFGMTGYWDRVHDVLKDILPVQQALIAVEDTVTAHAGAFAGGPGIILISGMGVAAYGVDPKGQIARVGGWGYVIGDEGGGYDMGIRCLRAVARAEDGRGRTSLLYDRVLETFGLDNVAAIQSAIYSNQITHMDIAHLSKLVARVAEEGDPVAIDLIKQTAHYLVENVVAATRRLGWENPPVSTTGGLFKSGEVIYRPFEQCLYEQLPNCKLVPPRLPPVLGAVWLALQSQENPQSEVILENLDLASEKLANVRGG